MMKRHALLKFGGFTVMVIAVCVVPHLLSSRQSSPRLGLSSGDSWLSREIGVGIDGNIQGNAPVRWDTQATPDAFDDFLMTLHLASTEPAFTCFSHGTPEEEEAILRAYPLMGNPPPANPLAFFTGGSWSPVGEGVTLTWSLVPDGTFISGFGTGAGAPSNMFATFDAQFANVGGRNRWVNLINQFLNRWTELNGNTYVRITMPGVDWDDGASFGSSPGSSTRGDIRISGRSIDGNSGSNILAFNFFPTNSDMVIDTDNSWSNTANNFRFFRDVLMHEHGHGLGMSHVCSLNTVQLMEPFINTSIDGLQHDDLRGGHRQHGDPFEPDNNPVDATDLGAISVGVSVTAGQVPFPNIAFGVNTSIDDDSEEDWFRIEVTQEIGLDITAVPLGFTYDNSRQNPDGTCPQVQSPFDSTRTANLNLRLFDANLVCASGTDAGSACSTNVDCLPNDVCVGGIFDGDPCLDPLDCFGGQCGGQCGIPIAESDLPVGFTEQITDFRILALGTYFIRVGELNESADLDGETQLYQLTIAGNIIPASEPPTAISGPDGFSKDRYITMNPSTNGMLSVAYRVTVPGGGFKYIGNVQDQGPSGFFAQLVGAPEFRVWPETALHVRGCEFVPGNTYTVESTVDDIEFSAPFITATTDVPLPAEYADIVGVFDGIEWTKPNGTTDSNDVLAVVKTFQLDPTAPHKSRADLVPQTANGIVGSDDILSVVLSFANSVNPFASGCQTGTCTPSCP